MYETPPSLKDVCLEFICDNVEALIDKDPSIDCSMIENGPDLMYSNQTMVLPQTVSEQLLTTMSMKKKLNDFTMGMFDHKHCTLSEIYLPDAKNLTTKGLRKLRQHKISLIKVFEMKVAVNDLIGCLGEWTLNNLRYLNVTDSTFLQKHYCFIISSISKLKCLHTLNVRGTEFNDHGLQVVVEDLPCIQHLDVSQTRVSDISLLKTIRHRLRYLAMHNITLNKQIVATLEQLTELRLLDVSEERTSRPFELDMSNPPLVYPLNTLLKADNLFPYMTSLDVSGNECVDSYLVEDFVRTHPKLRFLGVVNCDCCYEPLFTDPAHLDFNPELQIAGSVTEAQIILALSLYANKKAYVQKCLYKLFRLTQDAQHSNEPRPDIIELVLGAMNAHESVYGIQMAATACAYNLTKGAQAQRLHPSLLRRLVQSTLNAMANFPIHLQLQKNALLTLCSDRILQDVSYDKYRCAMLVMDCLCSFEDPSMNRMCVAICSILAAKIPTSLTSKLGVTPPYMVKLLTIVHRKTITKQPDMTLRFTLSALWNLTDESPETCETFIGDGGLKLYLMVLDSFAGVSAVETKVLGLINNIAEVPHLRHHLCDAAFLETLGKLLESSFIDVSYFAAGILSHLACHENTGAVMGELLNNLATKVLTWEAPEGEMVAYRSFKPFEPLLASVYAPVRLWAVWAIAHVCLRNPARYCAMLEREAGSALIRGLAQPPANLCGEGQPPTNLLEGNRPPANDLFGDLPAANHLVVDQPLANHLVVDQPPANDLVVDQPLANHLVVDQPLANHLVVDQPLANHLVVDQPLANHLVVDQPPANHLVVDQPLANHLVVDDQLLAVHLVGNNLSPPNHLAAMDESPLSCSPDESRPHNVRMDDVSDTTEAGVLKDAAAQPSYPTIGKIAADIVGLLNEERERRKYSAPALCPLSGGEEFEDVR